MRDKLQALKDHPRLQELGDIRLLGQIAFLAVVLLVSWSGVKVIQTNYELQQQIARKQQEIAVQELANQNMKLRNEYFKTPQYLELAARQNFGLAAPGEQVLLVPKEVALAYAPELQKPATAVASDAGQSRPFFIKNWQAWADFFLNRQPAAVTAAGSQDR